MEKPTLRITIFNKKIFYIAAKKGSTVASQSFELIPFWAQCWWEGYDYIEYFLELLETLIKKIISEIMEYDELYLYYNIKANDLLEDATEIEITVYEVSADETKFKLINDDILFVGNDLRSTFKKITSFRRKIDEDIEKKL